MLDNRPELSSAEARDCDVQTAFAGFTSSRLRVIGTLSPLLTPGVTVELVMGTISPLRFDFVLRPRDFVSAGRGLHALQRDGLWEIQRGFEMRYESIISCAGVVVCFSSSDFRMSSDEGD